MPHKSQEKESHPAVNAKSQASVHPQIYLEGGERQNHPQHPFLWHL